MRTETSEERLARAVALQAAVLGKGPDRAAAAAARTRRPGPTLAVSLDPATREILAGLGLHGRRYGFTHPARAALRKIGCRTLADVADTSLQACVDWLGYREAEAVQARMDAIVAEAMAGAAEPGVTRMVADLEPDVRAWLAERPVEDLAGRGITAKAAAALRAAGHASLAAVATEEADLIEDINGIGPATVIALVKRLAGIVAEGREAPSLARRRAFAAGDAEWEDAGSTLRRRGKPGDAAVDD